MRLTTRYSFMEAAVKVLLFCFLVICGYSTQAQGSADAIISKWLNHTKDAAIEMYESLGIYYGNIVWLKAPNDKSGRPKRIFIIPKPQSGLEIFLGCESYQA